MGVRLPAEYQEVEYLESTVLDDNGISDHINTGICPQLEDSLFIKFQRTGSFGGDTYRPLGAYDPGIAIDGFNGLRIWTNNAVTFNDSTINIDDGNVHTIFCSESGTWEYDGREIYKDLPIQTNTSISLILFRAHYRNGRYYGRATSRIYEFRYYRNGEMICSLVPCYRKQDSKPGMYDLVTSTFLTNAGDGEFLVGPDIIGTLSPRLMDRRRVLIAKLTSLFKNIISSETGIASFNTNFAKPMKVICEFGPKQEGTGDPSPENIRPISAWDGANIRLTKKNLVSGESIISILKNAKSSDVTLGEDEHGRYAELTTIGGANVNLTPDVKFKPSTQYTLVFYGYGENGHSHLALKYIDGTQTFVTMSEPYSNYKATIITSINGKTIDHLDIATRTGTNRIYYDTLGIFEGDISIDEFEAYQTKALSIPFNNPGTYDFLPIQEGTGDPSPENVRPITPGLTLTRDDNTTLEVWGGSLTVNADGTGTVTSKYHQCVYDGVNKKVNSSYLNDTYVQAGDVYCHPDGPVGSEASVLCDKLNVINPYDSASIYQIRYPATGALYFVFRIRLVDDSGVTNASECKSYVNGWFQDNPTTVVYKTKEASYQTYTLSVAETSRAFEALGLGKNLGPLYGGTVTINEDGSVDVVSDYIVAKASEMGGARKISFPTDTVARIEINSYNNFALASTSNKTSKCSILKQGNNYLNSSANSYYFYYDLVPSGYTNAESRILALFFDRTPEIEALTTPAEMSAYLDSIGFQIAYQVGNFRPTTYHFSSISELQSFIGANNIWSDLNGPITVEYYNNKKE